MENRQIVKSAGPPEDVATPNVLQIPAADWACKPLQVAASASWAGNFLEIDVPTRYYKRRLYAAVFDTGGGSTVGAFIATIRFMQGQKCVLELPFEGNAPSSSKFSKAVGLRVTSGYYGVQTLGNDCLLVEVAGVNFHAAPWALNLACSKIRIDWTAGTADAELGAIAILGCYSEGEAEHP